MVVPFYSAFVKFHLESRLGTPNTRNMEHRKDITNLLYFSILVADFCQMIVVSSLVTISTAMFCHFGC